MKKRKKLKVKNFLLALYILIISITMIIGSMIIFKDEKVYFLEGQIIKYENDILTIKTSTKNYNVKSKEDLLVGSNILIKYTGNLNDKNDIQKINIEKYFPIESDIPIKWLDNGIFKNYYAQAFDKLNELTIDEKINQLLLVRYPDYNQKSLLKNKQFGGYIFFERDFTGKSKTTITNEIKELQTVAKIPILTAVDEEGGGVVRISSNSLIRSTRFKSPQTLYKEGGFEAIKKDTIEKSALLKELGINLNLAPVVDVSTNKTDFMYYRSLGLDAAKTSEYAKTVIEASKGTGVSYTLKHFPGYGNNQDTHFGKNVDKRTLESIKNNDLLPFIEGIKANAESVMISHNIVSAIDDKNPASLSPEINKLLRDDLHFTGIIITDDLAMGATSNIKDNGYKAIKAGNNILITTEYQQTFNSIKNNLNNNNLTIDEINEKVFKVIAWKYYMNLIKD